MHEDRLLDLVTQLGQGVVVVKMNDVNDIQSIETLFVNAAAAELIGGHVAAQVNWPKSVLAAVVDALVTGKDSVLYSVEAPSSADLRVDINLKPLGTDTAALLLTSPNPIATPDSMPVQEARFRKTFEKRSRRYRPCGARRRLWLQVNEQMCDIVGRTRAESCKNQLSSDYASRRFGSRFSPV